MGAKLWAKQDCHNTKTTILSISRLSTSTIEITKNILYTASQLINANKTLRSSANNHNATTHTMVYINFALLPAELQSKIWAATALLPRDINVTITPNDHKTLMYTKLPSLLSTCREARHQALIAWNSYPDIGSTFSSTPKIPINPEIDTLHLHLSLSSRPFLCWEAKTSSRSCRRVEWSTLKFTPEGELADHKDLGLLFPHHQFNAVGSWMYSYDDKHQHLQLVSLKAGLRYVWKYKDWDLKGKENMEETSQVGDCVE